MIRLETHELQWVRGFEDDPTDQCAHGRVHFEVDGTTFVKPEDGLWTLSAAGLYLLRTLRESHSAANPVAEGNLLFPCCGFFVVNIGIRFPVFCFGCPNGVDLEIVHSGDSVDISSSAGSASVPSENWRRAVTSFTSSIRDFYRVSAPRSPSRISKSARVGPRSGRSGMSDQRKLGSRRSRNSGISVTSNEESVQ